jgi:diguanylate cyclase (GGDEF)-like protein
MGGDEFLLILLDTDIKSACILNERLCKSIDELNIQTGTEAKLGISIGLVQWQPGMSRKQWLEQADDILYQAKKNGRAQVAVN